MLAVKDPAIVPAPVRTDGIAEPCSIGPTDGFAVAVKDCLDIEGFRTRAGSRALNPAPATAHATAVERLLDGGATIVGRAAMHELAYGMTGLNAAFGTPVNPRYPALIPGGSSSGSAVAVANGLCRAALGTDTGGSVRVPAAACGLYGLKPTFGRVDRTGATPATSSLDCIGVLADCAEDLAHAASLLMPDLEPRPDTAPTIGWVATDADPAIAAAARKTAAELGKPQTVSLHGLAAAHDAGLAVMAHEMSAEFGHLVEDARLGEDIRLRLLGAAEVTDAQLRKSREVGETFRAEVDRALEDVDLLALPTLPIRVPALNELDRTDTRRLMELTRPFNLSGHPALALPAGELGGRPVSLQLVARHGREADLLAAARTHSASGHSSLGKGDSHV